MSRLFERVFAADLCCFFVFVRKANVGFTCLRRNFETGYVLYSIFLSSLMLFKHLELSIYRNLTELCKTPAVGCVVSPPLDVKRHQLQRLQESRKIRTL